jgi:hypothetical protein
MRLPPLTPALPEFPLLLTHLNPLFNQQTFTTWLKSPYQLMVPVAKDDHLPPSE